MAAVNYDECQHYDPKLHRIVPDLVQLVDQLCTYTANKTAIDKHDYYRNGRKFVKLPKNDIGLQGVLKNGYPILFLG